MSDSLKSVYLKLVLTTFFWGGTFVAARLAVKEAPPFFAAGSRFVIAATCLIALTASYSVKDGKPFPAPKDFRQLALLFSLGLTGIFFYNAVFFTGLKLTTATSGALIVAINPLLTAVLSALWLRERVSVTQGAGLLVSLLGVSIVISKGSWSVLAGMAFNRGDLIMLGAPLCWALYSILGKKALATFTPLAATAWAALFGAALLVPAAVVEHAVLGGPWPSFTWVGWLSILQLALLGTVVGFVWWYQGVGRIGASRAAVFVNLVPFFGAIQAALLLGERVVLPQLCGGMLVVAGVCLGSRAKSRAQGEGKAPAPEEAEGIDAGVAAETVQGEVGMVKTLRTVKLMWYALLPSRGGVAQPTAADEVRNCEPEEMRGGMGLFLDPSGELRLFIRQCRPIAAPLLLFRLKREGFSRCSVLARGGGLLVRARR